MFEEEHPAWMANARVSGGFVIGMQAPARTPHKVFGGFCCGGIVHHEKERGVVTAEHSERL